MEESVKEYNGIFTLSQTGALIFETISEGGSEDDAISVICDEFDVPQEDAAADVHSFIESLREYGIVE